MNRRTLWSGSELSVLGLPIAVALVAHAYAGLWTRYHADDYCTAAILQSQGLLGSQQYWYQEWTGRFSFTLAVSVAEFIGPGVVPLLAATVLALWLAGLSWAVSRLSFKVRLQQPFIISVLLAGTVIFVTLDATPNVYQSLYWQTGVLTYLAPLVLLSCYVGLTVHRVGRTPQSLPTSPWVVLISATLAFVAGGFSDIYVALQASATLMAVLLFTIAAPRSFKTAVLPLLIAGFVGSLLAMAVIILAPGNEVRETYYPPHPGFLSLAGRSIEHAFLFLRDVVRWSPMALALAIVLPASLAYALPPSDPKPITFSTKSKVVLLLSPFAVFIMVLSAIVPSIWGISSPPPERALVVPLFVLVSFVVFWGYLAGLALRQMPSLSSKISSTGLMVSGSIVVTVLLALVPVTSAKRTFAQVPDARTHASKWDSRDREIRDARQRGLTTLAVQALHTPGDTMEVRSDPQYWVNVCFSRYYGLDSATAR